MRKRVYLGTAIVILCLVIIVLLNNKRMIELKARPEVETKFPVMVINVKQQNVTDNLEIVGTISGSNDINVVAETTGRVKEVLVKVGDYVSAGSPLLKIDDELPRAQLQSAQTNYDKAKKDYERNQKLRQDELISDSQLESSRQTYNTAEAAYITSTRQYNNTMVTTPISGVVTSLLVEVGTYLSSNTQIANIVNISSLKLKVNIAEQDVIHLKVGDSVKITTDIYPNVNYNGWIATISVKGNDIHTYPVEINFSNNGLNPLKAGMFAKANFFSNRQHYGLVVPRDALIGSAKNAQVYVVEDGTAKLRDIILGVESGTDREVVNGLKEGDTVVINGQTNLHDNVPVTIVKQ